MTSLQPDPKQKCPGEAEISGMWNELEVFSSPLVNERFEHVIAELRSCHTNGGAIFVRFRINPHPVLKWFALRHNLRQSTMGIDFIPKFLLLPVVSETLGQTNLSCPVLSDSLLEQGSTFTLDGELAQVLRNGCAYPNDAFKGTDREAKELGNVFCAELFGDRYSEIAMFRSRAAWSPWFIDDNEIWNRSWFGFDIRLFSFWILALTDTD